MRPWARALRDRSGMCPGDEGPAAWPDLAPPVDRVVLTFDVDWAPDWAVERALAPCRAAGVPVTLFATHRSPLLEDLARDPAVELAIHPNLRPGSSHGSSPEAVLDACLDLVPLARSLRTHGLASSTPWLDLVADRAPSIVADSSLLLWGVPELRPVIGRHGAAARRLVRLPIVFEDDDAMLVQGWDWGRVPLPRGFGLRVLDLHPMLVALDATSLDGYRRLKARLEDRPLWTVSEAETLGFADGGGVGTWLHRLLAALPASSFATVAQVAALAIDGLTEPRGSEPPATDRAMAA